MGPSLAILGITLIAVGIMALFIKPKTGVSIPQGIAAAVCFVSGLIMIDPNLWKIILFLSPCYLFLLVFLPHRNPKWRIDSLHFGVISSSKISTRRDHAHNGKFLTLEPNSESRHRRDNVLVIQSHIKFSAALNEPSHKQAANPRYIIRGEIRQHQHFVNRVLETFLEEKSILWLKMIGTRELYQHINKTLTNRIQSDGAIRSAQGSDAEKLVAANNTGHEEYDKQRITEILNDYGIHVTNIERQVT